MKPDPNPILRSLRDLLVEFDYYGGFDFDGLVDAWIPQGFTRADLRDIWRRWNTRKCAGGMYHN